MQPGEMMSAHEGRLRSSYSGFNVETIEFKGHTFTMWDVGGACVRRAIASGCVYMHEMLLWRARMASGANTVAAACV